ncbi:unnamed protein product [Dicrocoelium dendriticum]|nr:unnamed protein product [Dicrocoelium dendriticum]
MSGIDTIANSVPGPPSRVATNNTSPVKPAAASHASTFREGEVRKGKKIGHRRVTEEGTVTYKKKPTSEIQRALQLGIQHHIGSIQKQAMRDVLYRDFQTIETVQFPATGTKSTPAHSLSDFRFRTYAPIAFRNFRTRYKLDIRDFLNSICNCELRELSNPGASGSIFYITQDDEFIIKTVQHREGEFLRALLPSYFMNLMQHPPTLLPKFHGFYCYQTSRKNIRFVVMNNLLPSSVKIHEKYDLKGSTHNRRASEKELAKSSPTLKDLDFRERNPHGIWLEAETYDALIKTIEQDCLVLESLQIMDYSLLLGIHNLDRAKRERVVHEMSTLTPTGRSSNLATAAASGGDAFPRSANHVSHSGSDLNGVHSKDPLLRFSSPQNVRISSVGPSAAGQRESGYHYFTNQGADGESLPPSSSSPIPRIDAQAPKNLNFQRAAARLRSGKRLAAYCTAMESIEASAKPVELDKEELDLIPSGGIPARNSSGDRLLLFVGVIDILQSYRLIKRLEHGFKTLAIDGESVSVAPPNFYSQRFQDFLSRVVFKRIQSPMKQCSSKKNPLSTRPLGSIRPADELLRFRLRASFAIRSSLSSHSHSTFLSLRPPSSRRIPDASHTIVNYFDRQTHKRFLVCIPVQPRTEAETTVVRPHPTLSSAERFFVPVGSRMGQGDERATEPSAAFRIGSASQLTEWADVSHGHSPISVEVDRRKFNIRLIEAQRRARSTMYLNQNQPGRLLPRHVLNQMAPDFSLSSSPLHTVSSTTSESDMDRYSTLPKSWTLDFTGRKANGASSVASNVPKVVNIDKTYPIRNSETPASSPFSLSVSDTGDSKPMSYQKDLNQTQIFRRYRLPGRLPELQNNMPSTKSSPVLTRVRHEADSASSTMASPSRNSKISEAVSLEYFMHDAVFSFLDKAYDPYGLARKNLAGSLSHSSSYARVNTLSTCSPLSSGQFSASSARFGSSPRISDQRRRFRQTLVRPFLPPS